MTWWTGGLVCVESYIWCVFAGGRGLDREQLLWRACAHGWRGEQHQAAAEWSREHGDIDKALFTEMVVVNVAVIDGLPYRDTSRHAQPLAYSTSHATGNVASPRI